MWAGNYLTIFPAKNQYMTPFLSTKLPNATPWDGTNAREVNILEVTDYSTKEAVKLLDIVI